jgi:isopenicillin N synthase-like dioxygenase
VTDLATRPTVIDFAALEAGDAEQLEAFRQAGEDLGIVQVVNHGVPQEVVDDFHDRAAAILALPRDQKIPLASPTGHPYRGWRQWPDDFGRLELERYTIGQFDSVEEAVAAGLAPEHTADYAHPNVWPEQDPGLRDAARSYYRATVDLAHRAVRAYGRALGQSEDVFPIGAGPDHSRLVVNNYPTWTYDDVADEDKLLLLEHADGSAVTILHQRGDYDGLQAQRRDGSWIVVPIVPGALQVFTGYLLTRWTNGRLRAGRHRVVAGGTVTRLSSGMFWHPSVDTVVEPLAPFVGPEGSDYEPILVWDTIKDNVNEYLNTFGRPDQVAAWQEGRPYVAALEDA